MWMIFRVSLSIINLVKVSCSLVSWRARAWFWSWTVISPRSDDRQMMMWWFPLLSRKLYAWFQINLSFPHWMMAYRSEIFDSNKKAEAIPAMPVSVLMTDNWRPMTDDRWPYKSTFILYAKKIDSFIHSLIVFVEWMRWLLLSVPLHCCLRQCPFRCYYFCCVFLRLTRGTLTSDRSMCV